MTLECRKKYKSLDIKIMLLLQWAITDLFHEYGHFSVGVRISTHFIVRLIVIVLKVAEFPISLEFQGWST